MEHKNSMLPTNPAAAGSTLPMSLPPMSLLQKRGKAYEPDDDVHARGLRGACCKLRATSTTFLASDFKCLDKGKGKGNFEVRFPVFPNFLGLVLVCIEAKFCK